jgi:hypothetical protein
LVGRVLQGLEGRILGMLSPHAPADKEVNEHGEDDDSSGNFDD